MGRSSGHKRHGGFFAKLFDRLFSGDSADRPASGTRKGTAPQSRRLRFEACEDRRLLSIGVDFTAGVLTLTGTSGPDQVSVVARSNYVDITAADLHIRRTDATASTVSTINFVGGGGNDSLSVQNFTCAQAIGLSDVESLSLPKAGNNVTVTSNGALSLGTSGITGNLSVTAGGALSQSGQVVVSGTTTLDAGTGNNITLDNTANNFNKVVVAQAHDVTLVDVNAVVLGSDPSHVYGNLVLKANQNSTSRVAVSQTGAVTVDGTTKVTTGSASTVTLGNTNNRFYGEVSLSAGKAATLFNHVATTLGDCSVSKGDLTVTANVGGITGSGALVVGKTATFTATGLPIDLSGDNDFATLKATGGNVTVNDVNALILGASTVTGTLTVTTAGKITQSGTLSVTGATSLTAGDTNDITLTKSTNLFSSVAVVSGNNVSLRDKDALVLGAFGATGAPIAGTLTVTTGAAISQTGGTALIVDGKTTLKAPTTYNITLGETNNDFSEVAVTAGKNVTIRDANDLILAASKVTGTLGVTTGGDLTQSGALVVKGTTTLGAGTTNSIDLSTQAKNAFSTVVVTGGYDVSLLDVNAIKLGASHVYHDLTVNANLNSSNRLAVSQTGAVTVDGSTTLTVGPASTITLSTVGNQLHGGSGDVSVTAANVTLRNAGATNLGASSVTGNLQVTSGGAIGQDGPNAGPVVVGKVATFSATAETDITLDDDGNNFKTVVANTVRDLTLVDVDALILGALTVGRDLNVKTVEGGITQSGAVTVARTTTLDAADYDIVLLNTGNDFSYKETTPDVQGIGITSAHNVAIRDADDLTLRGSTISGTLGLTTNGAINEIAAAVVDVAGKTTLTAAGNSISLGETTNNFSEVAVTSGDDVTLGNSDALILGASKISGDLVVTLDTGASGGVTQSGALVVVGATTVTADGNDVTLANAGNNFSTFGGSGNDVTVRDVNALQLATLTVSGDFLTVTAGGAITQGAAVTVASGLATFTTNASADITLGENNNFSTFAVTSGRNVTVNDATDGLILAASNISGALWVSTDGDLTQTGAVVVQGNTTLTATNVDLSTDPSAVDNNFATVSVSAADVALRDVDSIDLGASALTGDLTVDAGGDITDSGVVTVALTSTLTAGGDITLDTSTSEYTGALLLQGSDVSVTNNVATVVGDSTVTGDLSVVSNNHTITNLLSTEAAPENTYVNGAIGVTGTATFDSGTSSATIYENGCAFGALVMLPTDSATRVKAPVLGGIEPSSLGCAAGGAAVTVTSSIVISDPGVAFIYTATIQITGNIDVGDVLAYTGSIVHIAATGGSGGTELTLTGDGTVSAADFGTALRAVTFQASALGTGPRTVTFTVNDGTLRSNTVSRNITVGTAPVLEGVPGAALAYTENDPATVIASTITATDDSGNLAGATVQITTNYATGDVLGFTDTANIHGTWDSASHTLTLTGDDTDAHYQDALRSVTYENTGDDPGVLTRTVTFTVNDGLLESNAVTQNITVAAVNDPPVNTVPGAQTVNKDTDLALGGTISIADADDGGLAMRVTLSVVHGTLTVSGGGATIGTNGTDTVTLDGTEAQINATLAATVTYRGTLGYTGADTLTVTTSDLGHTGTGGILTDVDTVGITVNDPPVLGITDQSPAFVVGNPAVVINSSITVSDTDTAVLASATVKITGNYNAGDVLSLEDGVGGLPAFTATQVGDTLTITFNTAADGTVANFQTALNNVKFETTDAGTGPRTVTFTVNDGMADSNTVEEQVAVSL